MTRQIRPGAARRHRALLVVFATAVIEDHRPGQTLAIELAATTVRAVERSSAILWLRHTR